MPIETPPLSDVLAAARREVMRCQRAVDHGGDRAFWCRRLSTAVKEYEAATVMLRMQIAALEDLA